MSELYATGRVADLILALMVVEGLALVVFRAMTGRGLGAVDLACTLVAGAFLILALRAALVAARWEVIALLLAGAGLAHILDLWRRMRGARR